MGLSPRTIVLFFCFLGLWIVYPSCNGQKSSQSVEKRKKELAEKEEERKEKAEEMKEKRKEQHMEIQTKETRKRMKKNRKKANRYNKGKRKFFLIRWFEQLKYELQKK